MQHLRRLGIIAALICAFTFSAYAGDIECPVYAPPAPQPTATGNIECTGLQLVVSFIQAVLVLS